MDGHTEVEHICVYHLLSHRHLEDLPPSPQGAANNSGSGLEVTWSVPLVMKTADEATTAISFRRLLVSFKAIFLIPALPPPSRVIWGKLLSLRVIRGITGDNYTACLAQLLRLVNAQ